MQTTLRCSATRIYDAATTIMSATKTPSLLHHAARTLWKLDLDYKVLGQKYPDQFIAGVDKVNTIFDLPNTQQSLLYNHAAAGFPPKDTFFGRGPGGKLCNMARPNNNPNSQALPRFGQKAEGAHEGQQKGVRLTKVAAPVMI